MGLQLTAKKGKLIIPEAYLMISGVQVAKYLRPSAEVNPDTGQYDAVPDVQYVGRAQLYYDHQERIDNFGQAAASVSFVFSHVNGRDPVHECYAHIHANGVEGWVLNDMVDLV